MPSLVRRLWKWLAGTAAVLMILAAVAFGAFRLALEQIPAYRSEIQVWVRKHSGLDVEFASLDARWRLYGPELVFDRAVVRTADRQRTLATARRGSVALDLWASLKSGRLRTGRFSLERPALALVRTPEGNFELVGQEELRGRSSREPFDWSKLPTGTFDVVDASLTYHDLSRPDARSWALDGVDFEILRDAERAELHGLALLPADLGKEIKFTASTAGSWAEPAGLEWQAELDGSGINLAGWAELLPAGWPVPSAGLGTVDLATEFRGREPLTVSGRIDFENVVLDLPQWSIPLPGPAPMDPPLDLDDGEATTAATSQEADPQIEIVSLAHAAPQSLQYERVAVSLQATRQDGRWRAVLPALELTLAGRDAPASSRVELEYEPLGAGGHDVRLELDHLELAGVWPLLAYAPESVTAARARAVDAHGVLADVSVHARRASAEAALAFTAEGRFDSIGFRPVEKTPGLEGLSGEFRASELGGQLEVDARKLSFELPRYFREPLVADVMSGALTWRRGDDAWRMLTNEVRVENGDAHARATMELTVPRDGSSPILDLRAEGSDIVIAAAPRYLPAGRLRPKALAWLDRAFIAGKVASAELSYSGPTRAFPFRNGEGQFIVRAPFEDVTLDYQPGWAVVEAAAGAVEFRNAGFSAKVDRARLGGIKVGSAAVAIEDFKTPVLEIEGQATSDLHDALAYLQTAPVGPLLGERFMALEGAGATAYDVKLLLPLRSPRDRRLRVAVQADSVTVGVKELEQQITGLSGPLQVEDAVLMSPGLRGQFLGGPVEIQLARAEVAAGDGVGTAIAASGRASAASLTPLLHLPSTIRLAGETDWQLEGNVVRKDEDKPAAQWTSQFTVDSALSGLSVNLPEPFGKEAGATLPLHVELHPDEERAWLARAALGESRAIGLIERRDGRWQLERATLRVDGAVPALPGEPGLRIEGDVERFALEEWLELRAERGTGPSLQEVLRTASVRVGRVELWGYVCRDVRAEMRAEEAGWQINLAGDRAAGQIHLPYELAGSQPIEAALDRLILETNEDRNVQAVEEGDPRRLPGVQARVGDLVIGSWQLGNTQMSLARRTGGVELEQFQARTDSYTVDLSGSWLVEDAGQISRANLTLTSTDVRQTLRLLGYEDILTGKDAFLRARLRWPGRPRADLLAEASGTLSVSVQNGQLLKLQPGAGRLLGLLSVTAIPRRLSLDFRDITDKGFAFDVVQGDFELRDGDAYTSNLLLRGPAGEIGVVGRTGLADHDYDQTAVVTGNLSGSLGVAGALAGGPVVGAAVLLFSEIFKQPLQGMTRSYYRITGSWDDPLVERVLETEGKDAAAQSHNDAAGSQSAGGERARPATAQ